MYIGKLVIKIMLKFIIKNIFLEWVKLEKNQSFLNEYFKEYDKYDLSEIKSEKHQKTATNSAASSTA